MNDDSIIATQARSLIQQLRREQEQKCREFERDAADWRRERLREARRQARQKVRSAVQTARERRRMEIAAAAAEIDAGQRRERQAQLTRLLSSIMQQLPEQLVARWRDADSRRGWVEATLDDAVNRLGVADWTIRHAPGVAPAEMPERYRDARLLWRRDDELAAGLIVEKRGARLDASVAGLLAGSSELQSRVLLLLNEVAPGDRHE